MSGLETARTLAAAGLMTKTFRKPRNRAASQPARPGGATRDWPGASRDNRGMRRLLAFVFAVALLVAWMHAPLMFARGRVPGQPGLLSPHETTQGKADGAALSITYGRPSMRGRVIFGSLVPFSRVWCPGPDGCTRLTTDRALQFAGLTLKAGEYSLWMLPTKTTWTLIFNSDSHAFHTGRSTRLDVGRITLHKDTLPAPVEQLTFVIDGSPASPAGAITMSWETTRVSAPFTVVP
jgi:hypothetical protein